MTSSSQQVWHQVVLPAHATIGHAIQILNDIAVKIVLVVNEVGVLEGTVSDGDIRRGLLRGLNLDSSIKTIIHHNALVVPPDLGRDHVLGLMAANKIWQIPIVDDKNRVTGLHLWNEINSLSSRPNLMVIMAGGIGTRMLPHTEKCPKPLLKVSGKPMLEHIIERAKLEGFGRFIISIGYLGHMIKSHFGDGEFLGVNINYLSEDSPLGTAGALSLLDPVPDSPFVVTNGDVITDIRYGELIDFHIRHTSTATMAVRLYEWQNPFGVVQTQGVEIIGFEEKPIIRSHINAGVYALNPEALNVLISGERCDMPTLFERLQSKMQYTAAYPMHEPWLDVGRPDDLIAANKI